jgi:hypothetical protein
MNLSKVIEIRESWEQDEVNRLLSEGWTLLAVSPYAGGVAYCLGLKGAKAP